MQSRRGRMNTALTVRQTISRNTTNHILLCSANPLPINRIKYCGHSLVLYAMTLQQFFKLRTKILHKSLGFVEILWRDCWSPAAGGCNFQYKFYPLKVNTSLRQFHSGESYYARRERKFGGPERRGDSVWLERWGEVTTLSWPAPLHPAQPPTLGLLSYQYSHPAIQQYRQLCLTE